MGDNLGDRPVDQQVAIGDIGQTVASLRLVHVMGGDEERQALGGQELNLLPEIAAGLGIDAGGRLVEKEQLGLVNEAGGEGHPLFPAAGKLSRQLLFTAREAELFDAVLDGLAPVLHAVHAGDEIEILGDAEVLVKAEALGHVAHLLFDRFTVP